MKYNLLIALLLFVVSNCFAEDSDNGNNCEADYIQKKCISGDQPSYFVIVPESSDDQQHEEFFLSVKYPLWWWDKKNQNIYFGYTGKYDFYFASRGSSPVVSRLQNPGIFYNYVNTNSSDSNYKFMEVNLGLYHESNGQDIGTEALFIEKRKKIQLGDPEFSAQKVNAIAQDYISRSWNYVGVMTKFSSQYAAWLSENETDLNVHFRVRGYIDNPDDNLNWADPSNVHIEDYNTFNFVFDFVPIKKADFNFNNSAPHVFANARYEINITTGQELNNASYKLQATYHIGGKFPFTIFYYNGYLDNISVYYNKNEYIGFGIEVW